MLYPNPSNGNILIKGVEPGEKYRIIDINGKVFLRDITLGVEIKLDLILKKGTYFMEYKNTKFPIFIN